MFEQAFGLPLHILLVHAIVVGVPVAALASVGVATWPASRRLGRSARPYGLALGAVLVLDAAVVVLSWVAVQAGEALQRRLAVNDIDTPAIRDHAELGAWMPWLALALLVVLGLYAAVRGRGSLAIVASVLVVVVAAGAVVHVVRVGHSGSSSVFGYVAELPGSG